MGSVVFLNANEDSPLGVLYQAAEEVKDRDDLAVYVVLQSSDDPADISLLISANTGYVEGFYAFHQVALWQQERLEDEE